MSTWVDLFGRNDGPNVPFSLIGILKIFLSLSLSRIMDIVLLELIKRFHSNPGLMRCRYVD